MRRWYLLIGILATALLGGGGWWWKSRHQARYGPAAYAHTAAILALGPRPAGSTGLDKTRGYLRAKLEAAGWIVTAQTFERDTPEGKVKFENLLARFPDGQADPWQRKIKGVLGAHMDSKRIKGLVFLGADDAASACGALLEIARVLGTEQPARARQLELVFFDGEEAFGDGITPFDGLYGSRHYASSWRTRPDKPTFGIVLDMIGHKNLSIRLPSDTPEDLLAAVMAAAKKEGAASVFGMAPGPIIDDHTPLNLAGIPAVDIIGNFTADRWWHTQGDNLELISPESLDISIRVTLRALEGLLK